MVYYHTTPHMRMLVGKTNQKNQIQKEFSKQNDNKHVR